jgi:hypothetical protein
MRYLSVCSGIEAVSVAWGRQFRDVSNFNVGLFTSSAGLSLEQTMNMTKFIGEMSNYGSAPLGPNGVPARTEEFIRMGWFEGKEY